MPPGPDITRLLRRWNEGEAEAREQVLALLYDQLREIAGRRMRMERLDHTLGATGLVHEAYLKLMDQQATVDRNHLLALFSRAMRQVLIDYARARKAERRGGGAERLELNEERLIADGEIDRVIELDEALSLLEKEHPRPAQAVQHCYFGGLTNEEAAEAIGISRATLERDLRFARAWLGKNLG